MKRLFAAVVLALFLAPMLSEVLPKVTGQSVPNSDHMIIARTRLPLRIDPARMQWNEEFELCINVYEPLIFFDKEKISSFVHGLATSWGVSPDGLNYSFTLRQGVRFHNGEILTTEDVEYSFERILVDDVGWTAWMFYDAFLARQSSRDSEGNRVVTASQIDNAITRNDTTVVFHLARPYPPFMQILAAYGLIVSKDWCVALGEWPGTWDNWDAYNKQPSHINQQGTEPPGPHTNAMCGTGPFMLDYYQNDVNYSLIRFDDYWQGWPAPGASGSLQRVTVVKVPDWATRRDMFLAGELDSIDVPRTSADEVLEQSGIRCVYPLPMLTVDAVFFMFNISTSSPYLGVPGGLPSGAFGESGIPPDFFHDVMVRRAFAYALNYSQIIDEIYLGDGSQPATPIIPGLPFHNPAQQKYEFNLTKVRECLESAWNGQLWTNGFNMTICYNEGEARGRFLICEMLKANIESLNSKFHISLEIISWEQYRNDWYDEKKLPLFVVGWLADYADPHDFALGFMRSGPAGLAGAQNYRNETIDALVDDGIAEVDPVRRKEIYYELQSLYWEDCPATTFAQPRIRVFMRDWVQGWYYNLLFSTINYFYFQWKEYVPPHTLASGENVVNDLASSDTLVFMNTTSPGNLSIADYDINIEGTIEQGIEVHSVKCVTVDTSISPEDIVFPIEIRIYYTDQQVISAYVDQSTLRMYYWNGTAWILEADTGVVTPSDIIGYDGYVWAKIYHLSLFAIMGEPPPLPLVVSISPGSTSIYLGQSVAFTSTTIGGTPPYSYQWYLNDSAVAGATSSNWTFALQPIGNYNVYLNVTDNLGNTAESSQAQVTVASQLAISISPMSASMHVGESVTFTSSVSGGYPPYSYQWYLDGNPIPSATSNSWTFTPTSTGVNYVYLKVTDSNHNANQSDTARIAAYSSPVGGYSISFSQPNIQRSMAIGLAATIAVAVAFIAVRRKTRRRKP